MSLPADFPEDLKPLKDSKTIQNELGLRVFFGLIDENGGVEGHRRHCIFAKCAVAQHRNGIFESSWTYRPGDNAPKPTGTIRGILEVNL